MNNDELATRRAQAIAEDRCFSTYRKLKNQTIPLSTPYAT